MPDELDKIRDAIARLKGWDKDHSGVWCQPHESGNGWHCEHENHPVPASLDWVAQQWPKEREMELQFERELGWCARSHTARDDFVGEYCQTMIETWLRLYLDVLEAEHKETP